MPRFCLIVNPAAGRNARRPQLVPQLRDWIAAQRLDAEVAVTAGPHHATELAAAAAARGCERIVAVGGDGTMNEVARALVHTPAALGLVPCGSGNGLGRELGIRGGLARTLAIVRDGRPRAIDTATADAHPFFNVMGAGLDAEIARRFNVRTRRGLWGYLRTGVGTFLAHRVAPITLSDGDGWAATLPAFVVAVANSAQYGNSARIAPPAEVDDGRLDLVAVPYLGLPRTAALAARLFFGDVTRHPRVVHRRAAEFTLARGQPGPIHVDGETRDAGARIVVRVQPASLRIVVPAR